MILKYLRHFIVINSGQIIRGEIFLGYKQKIYLWITMLTSCINYDDFIAWRCVIMTTVVLNVKIDAELKEKLRHYAEVNNENLGTATEKLLLLAFQTVDSADEAGVSEEDIDSQHTEEEASPLTPKEIKALRKILKKKR